MANVNKEDLLNRITIDLHVMVGKPVIRGMRITAEQIPEALAGWVTEKELLEDHPVSKSNDINAALFYANELE